MWQRQEKKEVDCDKHHRACACAPGGIGEGAGKIQKWALGCEQGATRTARWSGSTLCLTFKLEC